MSWCGDDRQNVRFWSWIQPIDATFVDPVYFALLADPSRPKIQSYQGGSAPWGALWVSRVPGPWVRLLDGWAV